MEKQLHIWLHATSLQQLHAEVQRLRTPVRDEQGEWSIVIDQFQVVRERELWYFVCVYRSVFAPFSGGREG